MRVINCLAGACFAVAFLVSPAVGQLSRSSEPFSMPDFFAIKKNLADKYGASTRKYSNGVTKQKFVFDRTGKYKDVGGWYRDYYKTGKKKEFIHFVSPRFADKYRSFYPKARLKVEITFDSLTQPLGGAELQKNMNQYAGAMGSDFYVPGKVKYRSFYQNGTLKEKLLQETGKGMTYRSYNSNRTLKEEVLVTADLKTVVHKKYDERGELAEEFEGDVFAYLQNIPGASDQTAGSRQVDLNSFGLEGIEGIEGIEGLDGLEDIDMDSLLKLQNQLLDTLKKFQEQLEATNN